MHGTSPSTPQLWGPAGRRQPGFRSEGRVAFPRAVDGDSPDGNRYSRAAAAAVEAAGRLFLVVNIKPMFKAGVVF